MKINIIKRIKNPQQVLKILAVIVILSIAVKTTNPESDVTESFETENSSASDEADENPEHKYAIHIGTSNIAALAGCLAVLAAVKYKDHQFLTKKKK